MQFRYEHRLAQLVLAEHPVEALYQRRPGFMDIVPFRTFQQSGSHSVLVDRVNLVEVENTATLSVKEPGPFAARTLQRDQLAGTGVGHGNGRRISRELAVVIASNRQIRLGGERGKSPPEARR